MALAGRFRALEASRQLGVALVGVVLLTALLAGAWLLFLRTPYSTLFSDLRPKDAAAIVDELDRRKIPYRLVDDGSKIQVPANVAASTRLAVASANLPVRGTVGFELFNKSDMGLTEFAQKINYQRALQGELERTIMTIDTVETARVQLALSEPTMFRDDRIPPKASVSVTTRGGVPLAADAVRGITRFVAASVPGLDPANVVLLDGSGRVLEPTPDVTAIADSPFLQQKQAIELYLAGRVREALARAFPGSSMGVRVWAGLRSDGGEADPGIDPTAALTPDALKRSYPIRIVLTGAPALGHDEGELRSVVSTAVDLDASKGDTLDITADAPTARSPAAEATGAVNPVPATFDSREQAGHPDRSSIWLVAAAGAILLAGTVWLRAIHRRRIRRQAYVGRLQTLLSEEGRNVTAGA